MRRLLLVSNPNARTVTAKKRDTVAAVLSRAFDIELADTQRRGHARDLARWAARDGIDVVAVLGGDGTINEALNGLTGTGACLAVLPSGGANVLARSLGIPTDAVAAAEKLADDADGPPVRIPLGRMGERYFAGSCGVGFDASIVKHVEQHPRTKRFMGDLAFVGAGLRSFFGTYDRQRPHLDVRWGDDLQEGRSGVYLAVVQNTSPFTFLGPRPLRLCPEARLEDGLDLFAADTMRTRAIMPILFSAFGRARHGSNPHVLYVRDQRKIRISADRPMPVQVDGEYAGERQDVLLELEPDALPMLY